METQPISPENAAFHILPLGLITLDLNGTIQAINPAACRVLNLPADRLVGTAFASLHSGAVSLADFVSHTDGEEFWWTEIGLHRVQIRSTPIWHDRRKQQVGTLLQLIEQTNAMASAWAASRLLRDLTTDMGTPLTHLHNLTLFLLHNLTDALTEEQRDMIRSIGEHVTELARLREQAVKQYWELQDDEGGAPT